MQIVLRLLKAQTAEEAIAWLLEHNMVLRAPVKDPETFATANGYALSAALRSRIGSNLVKLFSKASGRRRTGSSKVTIGDALLAATIGAVLEFGQVSVAEDEMMDYANIILSMLPFTRIEDAGLANKPLRSLAYDRSLVRKIQRIIS
jgi:hypothetical protein